MSLFNTLHTGASGLSVSGVSLAVIGDNIANLNTTGYKRGTASFSDSYPNLFGATTGASLLGTGAATAAINAQHSQGMLMGTGSALDMAVTGAGYFMVSDGARDYYTRDGSFALDTEGYVISPMGYNLQGYGITEDGTLEGIVDDLQLDIGPVDPKETTKITLDAVLDPGEEIADDYTTLTLDGTGATIDQATDASDFETSITVYDSLGQPHDVVINFERTSDSDWTWSAVIDAGDTDVAGAVDGAAFEIASGTVSFDTDGNLTGFTQTNTAVAWTWPGADAFTFELELGLDAAGEAIDGQMRMVDGSESNAVSAIAQDGYGIGSLTSVAVDPDGIILANYSNGQERVLGQLALALFPADGGLSRVGGNLYAQTLDSGQPAMGPPGSLGRGTSSGYTLERSNVELEDEFVSMISAQRSYQASAGVVSTADEVLQALVQLV